MLRSSCQSRSGDGPKADESAKNRDARLVLLLFLKMTKTTNMCRATRTPTIIPFLTY